MKFRRPLVLALSGGGGNGAAQAAAVLELLEQGAEPDLYVGTSIGAWNAAWLAGHPGVEGARELVRLWEDGTFAEMAKTQPLHAAAALLGRRPTLLGPSGIDRFVRKSGFGSPRFEELATPLVVGAVDCETYRLRYWGGVGATGDVLPVVRASSALPPIFPPVEIDGRTWQDAGLVDNDGVARAVAEMKGDGRQFGTVIVVDAAPSQPSQAPKTVPQSVRAGLGAVFHGHLVSGAKTAWSAGFAVHVIEAGSGSIFDFRHPREGVTAGREAARAFLAGRAAPDLHGGLAV